MDVYFLLIPILFVVALAGYVIAWSLDHVRIRVYIESHGNTLIQSNWAPLGPGWLGAKGDRIYVVRYLNRDGIEHAAYCKTSALAGVYFTEDRIVHYAPPEDEMEWLREENRRLRGEVERLQQRQPTADSTAIKEL